MAPELPLVCNQRIDSSFITDDGTWLFAPAGRWNLVTGVFRRYPEREPAAPFGPITSPDGRYVAFFRGPCRQSLDGSANQEGTRLVVFDTRLGRERVAADRAFSTLSNGAPLSFHRSSRLIVSDRYTWLYAVPSLRLLTTAPINMAPAQSSAFRARAGPKELPTRVEAAAENQERLAAVFSSRICHVDGWVLPRSACE